MNKESLLQWLKERMESKSKQIDRLVEEGSSDAEVICEWGIYQKVISEVEKGTFD